MAVSLGAGYPWVTLAVGGFQPPVAPGTALIPLFHIGAGMLCHWKVETTRSEFDHNRTDRAAHSDSLCTIGECMKADRWFALTRWWTGGGFEPPVLFALGIFREGL